LSSGSYYWIPELPAFQILLILMPVTFLAGVTLKKKGKYAGEFSTLNGATPNSARLF
jgi:hypothetical protein